MSEVVPSSEHTIRGWFVDLTKAFVSARGDQALRRDIKNKIVASGKKLGIVWEKVCMWFRETVRRIERAAAEQLRAKYTHKYGCLLG